MQRVRIGIMGLAGVFLLVVLAAALYSLFGKVTTAAERNEIAANSADAPKEPLAELGVAPGNAPAPAPVKPTPARAAPTRR